MKKYNKAPVSIFLCLSPDHHWTDTERVWRNMPRTLHCIWKHCKEEITGINTLFPLFNSIWCRQTSSVGWAQALLAGGPGLMEHLMPCPEAFFEHSIGIEFVEHDKRGLIHVSLDARCMDFSKFEAWRTWLWINMPQNKKRHVCFWHIAF